MTWLLPLWKPVAALLALLAAVIYGRSRADAKQAKAYRTTRERMDNVEVVDDSAKLSDWLRKRGQ